MANVQKLNVYYVGDTSGLQRAMREINSMHSSLASRLGGTLRTIGAVGAKAFAWVTAGAVAATAAGIRVAANMEQAQIGFETMLGSAKRAKSFLEDLADFAAKTPFEFPDLVTASQRLLALGFDAKQVIPIMTNVGDAIAGLGLGTEGIDRAITAIGQIQAKGRLQAEEMMQLNELGIFSWQNLAEEIGTTVPTAMEQVRRGQVSSAQFLEAFMASTAERFGGLMQKQSQSLLGLLSTLKDEVMMRLGDTAGPLVESFKQAIPQVQRLVTSLLDAVGPTFARITGTLAKTLAGLLPQLAPVLVQLAEAVGRVLSALGPVLARSLKALAPLLGELAAAFGRMLIELVPLVPPLTQLAVVVARVLVAALQALAPVIDDVVVGLMGFMAARSVIGLFRHIGESIKSVQTMLMANPWSLAIAGLVVVAVLVIKHWDEIKAFLLRVWDVLRRAWERVWGAVKNFAIRVWDGIQTAAKRLFDFLLTALRAWLAPYRAAFNVLRAVATAVWEGISSAARTAWDRIRSAGSTVLGWLRDGWRAVRDVAVGAWNAILAAARAVFNAVASAWNNTVGRLSLHIPSWVPLMGGKGFDVPDIPLLASGGIVTRPTLALLGEGGPEAVLPLRSTTQAVPRVEVRRMDVRLVLDRHRFAEAADVEYVWSR